MRVLWALPFFVAALVACADDANSGSGEPCSSDATCGELSCIAQQAADPEDVAPLSLVCGQASAGEQPGAACEASSDCARGVCLISGACAEPCEDASDCGERQRCDFVYARTATEALQTLHACVAMVDLPDDAVVKVSTRKRALGDGFNEIDLPAVTDTTLFVLEHLDDDRWPFSNTSCRTPLCAEKLVTRDTPARVLFDLARIQAEPDGPLNTVANDAHVSPLTVLLPNSTRSELSSSGYTLTAESTIGGDLRVTQLARAQTGQRLDLNVFYVGAKGFTPTDARGPALLADALDEVDSILGQADIFVGDVRQIEISNGLLEHGTPIDGFNVETGFANISSHFAVCPALPELFKLSAGAGNSAINVFFVADIGMCNAAGDIGGISGGTPGPLGMHGTAGSGIAISTDMMVAENNPKKLGRTLAHEIGHMLGLFHTREVDGAVYDPLDDTNGTDTDNLMFPTTDSKSTKLTPDQRAVLRAALILR